MRGNNWVVDLEDTMEIKELELKAKAIRRQVIKLIYGAKGGHTGGALSSTDILTALFYGVMNFDPKYPKWENRDRFILSKGHSVEPYWSILADLGFFDQEELRTYSQFGTRLIGHPNNKVPGVEMNTGSLGHGLPVAVGMAIAAKKDGRKNKVYVLMGDGEQAEGSVWEGAMAASHYKLDNLVAILDRNHLQISGNTEDVMSLEPLADKWTSFGWHVKKINGNSMTELVEAFRSTPYSVGKPTLILAETTKGKGVSFMENNPSWHHKVPTPEQYELALKELE
jgi:transketolase